MRGFKDTIIVRRLTVESEDDFVIQSDGSWAMGVDDVVVRGSFHHELMYDRNPDLGGQYAERIMAIARLPLNTAIGQKDQIVIENNNAVLNGVYEVDAVMHTPTHLRVSARRISV